MCILLNGLSTAPSLCFCRISRSWLNRSATATIVNPTASSQHRATFESFPVEDLIALLDVVPSQHIILFDELLDHLRERKVLVRGVLAREFILQRILLLCLGCWQDRRMLARASYKQGSSARGRHRSRRQHLSGFSIASASSWLLPPGTLTRHRVRQGVFAHGWRENSRSRLSSSAPPGCQEPPLGTS